MQNKQMNCPLCHKEVYSELGKGCKMCGMPLEDKGKEFCSRTCRNKYKQVNINNDKEEKS